MMPERRVGKQPLFQPRRRAREAEGGEDDERHRRQQRQKSADRTKAQRSPARDQIEMPFHAGAGLADLSRPATCIVAPAQAGAASGLAQRRCVNLQRRSEEHTSELQSLMRISYAVFCLKTNTTKHKNTS